MVNTTTTSAEAWRPNVVSFAAAEAVPASIILQASTVAGAIEGDEPSLLVPYVVDDEAAFVAEGAPIDEADPTFAQAVVHTAKVAQLVRVSREQMAQPGASERIMTSVQRAVVKAADRAFLAQAAPTAPAVSPAPGLLNVDGITDGGTVAGDLDPLVDAVAGIEAAGGTATHIIAAPDAWASLSKFKAATGSNQSLLPSGTTATERAVLGVPVLVTPAMTAGGLLVLDQTAVVSAVGQVQVARSADAYFASDSEGVRVTWRIGQTAVRVDRIASLTVTPPA